MKRFCTIALALLGLSLQLQAGRAIPDTHKVGGFALGCQAYTFKEYTAFEAIEKTAQAGGRTIEFFLWQNLKPGLTNVVLNEDLSDKHIAMLQDKLEQSGVMAVSGYIRGTQFARYGTNEMALRKVFVFAKKMGFVSLTGEPPESSLDLIEKLVKEFDIQFVLHNHRREEEKPDYKYWDPDYNLNLMKNRDPRMGVCLDTGHLVRSGLKPVDALKKLKDRVLALHLKDPSDSTTNGHDTIFGTGVGNVKEVLKELYDSNFGGYISIEYEHNWTNQVSDLVQCVNYVRAEGNQLRVNAVRAAEKTVTLPPGFRYEVLVQGDIPEPVHLQFAPDGRLWFTGRRGHIWAYDFRTKSKTLIAQLRTPFEQIPGKENNERGLHGIEFDPKFSKNGYLYVYYSIVSSTGYSNRVSRFTVSDKGQGNSLVPHSEKKMLEFVSSRGYHQGGAIQYNAKDKKLYITTGDNNVSPETKSFFDDPNNPPQVLSDLRGKTLRLNLDGSIPKDNPFVKVKGARGEIFTYGHRNPYSLNIDPQTGRVFVGEVGYDRKEDIEEVNLLQAGGNYGWPRCIGTNTGTFGGSCPITNAISPWIAYSHEGGGASITSGPFYRANGGKFTFPAQWQNGVFYSDYSRKWIRFGQVDPKSYTVTNTIPFSRGMGGALAMQQGPDGALYFCEYGGWFTGSSKDRIARIVFDPKLLPANASTNKVALSGK